MNQITIYNEPGRFAGWPANYGIWNWGDEIVVSFTVGAMDVDGGFHARDKTQPFVTRQARSLDGGLTWEVAEPNMATPGDRGLSADEHMVGASTRKPQRIVMNQQNLPNPAPHAAVTASCTPPAVMTAEVQLSTCVP